MWKPVKLQLYTLEGEKTYVDSFEAQSFEDFVIVAMDTKTYSHEELNEAHVSFSEVFKDRKVIILDKMMDVSFVGLRELKEIEN